MSKIAENIRFYRKLRKMTLDELAERVNVSKQTISRYENGIISNIPYDRIVGLSGALEVTPGELMGWNVGEKPISSGDTTSDKVRSEILKMYTLRGFAEMIGVAYDDLVVALDNLKDARVDILAAISRGLGVSVENLIAGKLNPQPSTQSSVLLRANNLSPARLALVENLIKEFLKEEGKEEGKEVK